MCLEVTVCDQESTQAKCRNTDGASVRRCDEPKDEKDTIQFYQLENQIPFKEWQDAYPVVDRTNLEIASKLDEISDKLDEFVRKGN